MRAYLRERPPATAAPAARSVMVLTQRRGRSGAVRGRAGARVPERKLQPHRKGDPMTQQRTAGGLAGKVVGKAKEAIGSATGNDDLAREGRLQQIQGDAEREARESAAEAQRADAEAQLREERAETELERQRLENEVAAMQREQRAERDRAAAEQAAAADAARRQASAEAQERLERQQAERAEEQAERARLAAAQEEIRLQREARQAQERADAIDPEEDR